MIFRILGALRAGVGGEPVDLGGRRARLVLAALLLEPGRAVPVDRLIDVVWPDRPPASARTQVAIAVSGLRRTFRQAGCADEVIETVRPGYRILTRAIDALAAEERIGAARRDVAAGRPAKAAERFRDALALWDGPVLAGLDRPAIEAAAHRWEELRLTAVEERARVELMLGRHHELVGELVGPVGEQPYRERLRALLMIALARAGRRGEALDVYHAGRRRLNDDLGLEPGRELRDLHMAILRDDPSTHPRAPAASYRGPALRWRRTSRFPATVKGHRARAARRPPRG
ncbi:AfsR/SARP family transcriptional regulator [Actinomadura meridiana]|uniref:AfsR/SARP family transcriptional regulator n=1 Tax=Actinomadura meridiana TaxID=559626 RepID=UPI0031F185A4